jgi:hypothetical protein
MGNTIARNFVKYVFITQAHSDSLLMQEKKNSHIQGDFSTRNSFKFDR